MYEEYGENKETSSFNEAKYQVLRLHVYWTRAEQYANAGLLQKWRFILDSIWRELYPDVLRLENTKEIKKRNYAFMKYISISKGKTKLYFALNERHEFLKEIQDKCGKGGLYHYADTEAFE